MATYVLVHGAWSGAHGFHLVGPHVDLSLHARDVVNTVLYEDLHDIVLLGFSYGGMVVTGALEHIGDRVAHLASNQPAELAAILLGLGS